MSALYTLTVRDNFSAAHKINGYDGPCARLHGHNYHVEVEICAKQLTELAWVVDFQILKDALRETLAVLDHYYLNELPIFEGINPTAEIITRWIYQDFKQRVQSIEVEVKAINLWETQRCRVRYEEQ